MSGGHLIDRFAQGLIGHPFILRPAAEKPGFEYAHRYPLQGVALSATRIPSCFFVTIHPAPDGRGGSPGWGLLDQMHVIIALDEADIVLPLLIEAVPRLDYTGVHCRQEVGAVEDEPMLVITARLGGQANGAGGLDPAFGCGMKLLSPAGFLIPSNSNGIEIRKVLEREEQSSTLPLLSHAFAAFGRLPS